MKQETKVLVQGMVEDLSILKSFISVCCLASFLVAGSESEAFLDELREEARGIGKKINLLGGENMMQSLFKSLSLDEQTYVDEAWHGIAGWN